MGWLSFMAKARQQMRLVEPPRKAGGPEQPGPPIKGQPCFRQLCQPFPAASGRPCSLVACSAKRPRNFLRVSAWAALLCSRGDSQRTYLRLSLSASRSSVSRLFPCSRSGAPIIALPLYDGVSLAGKESSLWRSTCRLARALAHSSASVSDRPQSLSPIGFSELVHVRVGSALGTEYLHGHDFTSIS